MKLNYILDNFESLVCEIKNLKFSLEQGTNNTLQQCAFEHQLTYPVNFREEKNQIKYSCSGPINHLHPCYIEEQFKSIAVDNRYIKLIDLIVTELQIKLLAKDYSWKNTPSGIQLHIKTQPISCKETPESQFFNYCFLTLQNESELIESIIKAKVLKCKSEEETTLYIQKNQQALDTFIAKLIKRIHPNSIADLYTISPNYDRLDCLKLTFIFADKVLAFLESEYTSSLNHAIPVSNNTLLKTQNDLSSKYDYIQSRIMDSKLQSELKNIALFPLYKFSNITINETLKILEFEYCCKYINKAFKKLKNLNEPLSDERISDWLFEINLNTLSFFDYLIDKFRVKLQLCDTPNQRLDTLYFLLKIVNQKPDIVNIKLKAKLPLIKQQLIRWLEEEISYSKKKIATENNVAISTNEETKIKLHSGLTVAQLSYFSNLLLKSDIIKTENQSEVFQFMATNFKTNMTDKISPESFRSKYYNVEETTKHFVREKIIDLLNLTKT